jgi:hypothetical protein
LNIDNLDVKRGAVLSAFLLDIEQLSEEKIRAMINALDKKDDRGRYSPFPIAACRVLSNFI